MESLILSDAIPGFPAATVIFEQDAKTGFLIVTFKGDTKRPTESVAFTREEAGQVRDYLNKFLGE